MTVGLSIRATAAARTSRSYVCCLILGTSSTTVTVTVGQPSVVDLEKSQGTGCQAPNCVLSPFPELSIDGAHQHCLDHSVPQLPGRVMIFDAHTGSCTTYHGAYHVDHQKYQCVAKKATNNTFTTCHSLSSMLMYQNLGSSVVKRLLRRLNLVPRVLIIHTSNPAQRITCTCLRRSGLGGDAWVHGRTSKRFSSGQAIVLCFSRHMSRCRSKPWSMLWAIALRFTCYTYAFVVLLLLNFVCLGSWSDTGQV